MLKYAKIINEETKLCEVGLGNPEKNFEEKIIPEKSHEETIPAEYDEEGNLIKDEEIIKVIDEAEHTETITVGDWYKSLGMEKMEVEKAYNGSWYVAGFAPEKPAPTKEEISALREQAYTLEVDKITCHINRLKYEEQTPEIIAEIEELKQERDEKVEEIKQRYPYQ